MKYLYTMMKSNLEDIDDALCDEGYNINICEWCKENDIDLEGMIYEAAEQIVEDRRI